MANNRTRFNFGIQSGNVIFPTDDGGHAGYVLTTNGSNTLSFSPVTGTISGAANAGSAGVGVFKNTTSGTINLKNIAAASNKLSVVDNTGTSDVDIDVVPGNIPISALSGYGTMASATAANYSTTTQANALYVALTAVGAASGVAPLDSGSKVPLANLPSSVTGAVHYISTWNASTNSPALASGTGTNGGYYVISVAGTTSLDGIGSWEVGDWAVFNGTVWQRVQGASSDVLSFNSRLGAVVPVSGDYTGTLVTVSAHGTNIATNVQTSLNALEDNKLTTVSADTAPSLGGNLTVTGRSLVTTANGNIVLAPNGTGRVLVGTVEFGQKTTFTIANNQASAATILSYVAANYSLVELSYVLDKESGREYGTIMISSLGTTADMQMFGGSIGAATGVTFSVTQSGGANLLQYVSTNGAGSGTLTYVVKQF